MPAPENRGVDARPITVGLVNNMPDGAFVDTERQFRDALTPGAGESGFDLRLYTMAGLPRSEDVVAEIRSRYEGLDQLWDRPPDALIITGTEPVQAQLQYEPYWPYLARLLDWASETVPTTLLSCLAAHASTLMFDGIERIARPVKCSGVFEGAVNRSHPLAAGLPDFVPVPHSRVNDVPEEPLIAAGYEIVIGSGPAQAGWAIATRSYGERVFVLCQGHPEYSTRSLLREYRRDVRRYLHGRGAIPYPRIPDGYVPRDAAALLEEFEKIATGPDVDPVAIWETFPYDRVAAALDNSWAVPSATFYANWLGRANAALPV
jgi:homoserine O-succinyltransferase